MSTPGELPKSSCYCNPIARHVDERPKSDNYTDADLAADLNALTFQERQALEEDIHGVASTIEETPDLNETKVEELKTAVKRLNSSRRSAWDRAVFLRPALEHDRDLHLMFLRSRRFDVHKAAQQLAVHFENKRRVFGDDLLIHRITVADLTEKEKKIILSGIYRLIPSRERTGRGVAYSRMCQWDVSDPKALARCLLFIQGTIHDYPDMQKNGMVNVGDLRGEWMSSNLQMLQFLSSVSHLVDNLPFHMASNHMLYDNHALGAFMQSLWPVVKKEIRLRNRMHFGSNMEIDYSLRTFGMQLGDCQQADGTTGGPLSLEAMTEELRRREQLDVQWRTAERPYRDPSSQVALFPNPQDIILGRNKKVASTWPGNIRYNQVIEQQAHRYLGAETGERLEKTFIALETLQILRTQYQARFLSRKESSWETVSDSEAQQKIGQALRNVTRGMWKHIKRRGEPPQASISTPRISEFVMNETESDHKLLVG